MEPQSAKEGHRALWVHRPEFHVCLLMRSFSKDGHREWITCVAQTPDNSVVVTGGLDNAVCMWRGASCVRLGDHNASVSAVAADASMTALSASYDGACFWFPVESAGLTCAARRHGGGVVTAVPAPPERAHSLVAGCDPHACHC
jgi:WD40 repeat protein